MSRRRPFHPALLVALVLVLAGATGVALAIATGSHHSRQPGPPSITAPVPPHPPVEVMPWSWTQELAFYQPPAPLVDEPPGTLVRIQHLAPDVALPPGTIAWRILYHSLSIHGHDIVDSGIVLAPGGRPPPGGWPLVTFAHATVGIADFCAPSRYSDIDWISDVHGFLAAGYAVAATDYQGLGAPGVHPYLVGTSEARSVLDAARAAREIPGLDISNRVVAVGFSQGGQAVLFAGQQAASYAPDIDLLGVVAMSPGIAIPRIIASLDTSADLNGFFVTVAYAWSHTYSNLPITSLLTPEALAKIGVVQSQCEDGIGTAYSTLQPDQVEQPGLSTDAAWQEHLEQNDPGHSPTYAPILIVQGEEDLLIPYRLDEQFAQMVCARQHDRVTFDLYPTGGHYTATVQSRSAVLKWVAARFASEPAPSTCRGVPAPRDGVVPDV